VIVFKHQQQQPTTTNDDDDDNNNSSIKRRILTIMEREFCDEFFLSLVRHSAVKITEPFVVRMISLVDDTLLIQTATEIHHVSQTTGEMLNHIRMKAGEVCEVTPWDQESVVICTYNYHLDGTLPCIFSLWNLKIGERSTPVMHEIHSIQCMSTLPLDCSKEKYLVVGFNREVRLMRVPSFEVIHILCSDSCLGAVEGILTLLDGNSFMCSYKSVQLIRWSSSTNNDNKATCGGFRHQIFEGIEGTVKDLIQMRHDPRKLIVSCEIDRISRDKSYIWDIETATFLYSLPYISLLGLFELGDSGLFVEVSFCKLCVWDLRGEAELLSETEHKFEDCIQLRNGNVLLSYTRKGITYLEEHQLFRSVIDDSSQRNLCH